MSLKIKISSFSSLPQPGIPLQDSDVVPIVRSDSGILSNKKTTVGDIRAYTLQSGSQLGLQLSGSVGITGSLAQGSNLTSSGQFAHSEGNSNRATGDYSHAEGNQTTASGTYSHAEGQNTVGYGGSSHAEGSGSISSGSNAHAEGYRTNASGSFSHAEGNITVAGGSHAHSEGYGTITGGDGSHAEGINNIATGLGSHAEGTFTTASGDNSHSEGSFSYSNGTYTHTEGSQTTASGQSSHAEGQSTKTGGQYSHSEGYFTSASGAAGHAEGFITVAIGVASHAEGESTIALGDRSHSEGISTWSFGNYSHAEGTSTTASGQSSHAEGWNPLAAGKFSHAEGTFTTASGFSSHTEGNRTVSRSSGSHAEGTGSIASGSYSHAEGNSTIASGSASHSEGLGTIAAADFQHVSGKYNATSSNTNDLFLIGCGSSSVDRRNILVVTTSSIYVSGSVNLGSTGGEGGQISFMDSLGRVAWTIDESSGNMRFFSQPSGSDNGYLTTSGSYIFNRINKYNGQGAQSLVIDNEGRNDHFIYESASYGITINATPRNNEQIHSASVAVINGGTQSPSTYDFYRWGSTFGPTQGGIKAGGDWTWDSQMWSINGISFKVGVTGSAKDPDLSIDSSGKVRIHTTGSTAAHLTVSGSISSSADIRGWHVYETTKSVSAVTGSSFISSSGTNWKLYMFVGCASNVSADGLVGYKTASIG